MKCSFCNRRAIYYRANEGKYYCRVHFIRSFERRVKRTISAHKLVKEGDVIAVALSGGKDSSATLYLLNKFFHDNPKIRIFAITVDQGIEGITKKNIEAAKKLTKKLGIEHHIFTYKEVFGISVDEIAKKLPDFTCGTCAILRRYILNKKARELGATKLATGHNLDDECQSALMNLLKGDLQRLVRLGPMPHVFLHPKFVVRVKPLVTAPERESALYAHLKLKGYFASLACPYKVTNPLRYEAQQFLNRLEASSPGIKHAFQSTIYKIIPNIKAGMKLEGLKTCKKCGEPSSQEVCRVCQLLELLKSQ